MYITVEELEAVLRLIQTVRSEESNGSIQQEDEDLVVPIEDVELSVAIDVIAGNERQDTVEFSDLNTQTEESGFSVECEPDQLYSNDSYTPYLTLETTPSLLAAYLAAAIRESSYLVAQGTADALAADPYLSKRQETGNWTAAFNAGRLVQCFQ